jgi:hypothetical protein
LYIKLDGKERELKFTYKTLKTLEDRYDIDLNEIIDKLNSGVRIETINTFIWAMLKNKNGWLEASIEDIEDAIDEAIENEEFGIDDLAEYLRDTLVNSVLLKNLMNKDQNQPTAGNAKGKKKK